MNRNVLVHTLAASCILTGVVTSISLAQASQTESKPAETTDDSEPATDREFPDSWYMVDRVTGEPYGGWADIEGFAHPRLKISGWVENGIELESLKGKVVVVNFWSLECGPCVTQFPKNVEMARELTADDFVWLSLHDDSRSRERLPGIVKQFKPGHPVGVDQFNISAREWNVPAHPYYYVIDRSGAVRAMGLKRRRVAQVARQLLDEPYDPQHKAKQRPQISGEAHRATIAMAWLEGSDHERRRLANAMDLANPPSPKSDEWLNSEPLSFEQLRGKVVMLDFWATWCMPCRRAVPKTNELYETYKDQGFEIIGICHPRGVEKMATTVEQWNIEFPVCADTKGTITEAYRVNGWPDYFFIDRSGRLRVIDAKNEHVEDIIQALLAEPVPAEPQPKPLGNNSKLTQ